MPVRREVRVPSESYITIIIELINSWSFIGFSLRFMSVSKVNGGILGFSYYGEEK